MGAYKNVMELLVEEEVVRQFKALSPRVAPYIKQTELVAYALNQLPPLYATSEKGLECQLQRGKAKYAAQIAQAVKQAVAGVCRDPLRTCTPLQSQQSAPLREVLHQLRVLLQNDKVEWETLPAAVAQALTQTNSDRTTWQSRHSARTTSARSLLYKSSPFPQQPLTAETPVESSSGREPIRQGGMTEYASQSANSREDPFGWDDPLYSSQ
jgi:hypothetical protein